MQTCFEVDDVGRQDEDKRNSRILVGLRFQVSVAMALEERRRGFEEMPRVHRQHDRRNRIDTGTDRRTHRTKVIAMGALEDLTSAINSLGEQLMELFSHLIQKRYIERVIFNAPATIVFWSDGTKSVVKCHECSYSDECAQFRTNDGACRIPGFNKSDVWRKTGVIHACLKKTFPNYLSELNKIFGDDNAAGSN